MVHITAIAITAIVMEIYKRCTEHFNEAETVMPQIYIFEGNSDDYKEFITAINVRHLRHVTIQFGQFHKNKFSRLESYEGRVSVTLNTTRPALQEIFDRYIEETYDSILEFSKDFAAAQLDYYTQGDISKVVPGQKKVCISIYEEWKWIPIRQDWLPYCSRILCKPNGLVSGIAKFNIVMFENIGVPDNTIGELQLTAI